MSARDEILRRAKDAVGSGAPQPLPPFPPLEGPDTFEERVAKFGEELTKVAGRFYRAASHDEAVDLVVQIAREAGATAAVVWDVPSVAGLRVAPALAAAGIAVVTPPEDRDAYKQALDPVQVGVTGVDFAVAETGTIAVLAAARQPRSFSLLPPIHVALLPRDRLVGTLDDLFRRLAARGGQPSATALITGPSRSADIELTPVLGAHGPNAIHVILLDF